MSKLQVETISHTNNTTAMTIDSSGRVLQPTIPAFRVGIVNSISYTSSGSDITIEWDEGTSSENDNCFSQGGFSWNSGVATIPISGIYQFDVTIRVDNVGVGLLVLKIKKNNSDTNNQEYYSIEGDPASDYQALTVGGVFKMTANDTVRATIYSSADSSYAVNNSSIFSGHFVG